MDTRPFFNLFKINRDFDQQGIFLNLCGPLSQNLMVEMGGLMKTKMALEGSDAATIKKAFSVLVELNQNIIHYSAEKEPDKSNRQLGSFNGCGIISIGKQHGNYFLLSGNLVENSKVDKLKLHLDKVKSMTKEQLKEEYRTQRKKGPQKDSKGAGLGLIDIARKSISPLEFKFDQLDAQLTFFSLKTII